MLTVFVRTDAAGFAISDAIAGYGFATFKILSTSFSVQCEMIPGFLSVICT